MWVTFKDKTLKKRSVEVVPFSLFNCEFVIIDFGPELPEEKDISG